MLKRLQWRLVLLTMAFMTAILFGTLLATYISSSVSFDRLVENSLNRVLNTNTPTRPYIGVVAAPNKEEAIYGDRAAVWVDIDADTDEMVLNDSAAIIGPMALNAVLEAAESTDANEGVIDEYNVMWKRGPIPTGERIAIASLNATTGAHITQIVTSIGVGLAVLAVAFLFVWQLSKRMIQPVRMAWEAQRRFTADASHELKTPLAVIQANNRILEGDREKIPEEDLRWIDSNVDEAKRMQVLVNGLLELSKADEAIVANGAVFDLKPLNLSELVASACLEFEVVAFERGLSFVSQLKENLWVNSDAQALDRVMRIFLDNAVKYAEPKTAITVSLTEPRLGTARLAVNNHGDTLSPSDVEHIFDRFYRSDASRSRSTGGAGLGLAIAQSITVALGGSIRCTSTDEDGTTFSIDLPLGK